jgi:acetylornithine deacetylase/succinyl-diaminopimelate desuccinylase-like protein
MSSFFSNTVDSTSSTAELNEWEQILFELLSVPSVTGNERAVAEVLESHLRRWFPSAVVWRQSISDDRWNLIMERGDPTFTLTSHMDVVPGGPVPAWTADTIIGRGACDAKGQIVAQLWGLHAALARGITDYRCAYVVGEESDAVGAQALLHLKPTQYILNGEPTENRFVKRAWGSLDLELSTAGRSAHSSLGTSDSAIHKLVSELSVLLANQPEDLSFNVGVIRGGLAANVQAPFAACDICVRIRGSSTSLEGYLPQILKEARWVFKSPPTSGLELYVPKDEAASSIEVRFASDCSLYVQRYDRVMLFGPGRIQDAHTDNESLSRAALREAAGRICDMICSIE